MSIKIKEFLKNKYLIIVCVLLLGGTVIGSCVLNILPEELKIQLGSFVLKDGKSILNIALDKFALPFFALLLLYIGSFNAAGHITAAVTLMSFGTIYGIKESLNFSFYGEEFIIKAAADYLTFSIYALFLVATMAESCFLSAQSIYKGLHGNLPEKTHYNAKNQTVKLIAFTVITALFSLLSGYVLTVI